ncbi:MAG: hypothetical protein ACBZ72_07795 [Candidatus Bathyarchaeia archaeon]|jgi:hypothetical protein
MESQNTVAKSLERTSETISETILAVMDKLAGKQSDLKLSFQDLTLEVGVVKAKVNGAVVLDVVYSKGTEEQAP